MLTVSQAGLNLSEHEAVPTIEVTERELAAIEQMRMTPEQRRAEIEQRRQELLARLAPEKRAEIDAFLALPPAEQRARLLLEQQRQIAEELAEPAMRTAVERLGTGETAVRQ